jgi:hypothetical protein
MRVLRHARDRVLYGWLERNLGAESARPRLAGAAVHRAIKDLA